MILARPNLTNMGYIKETRKALYWPKCGKGGFICFLGVGLSFFLTLLVTPMQLEPVDNKKQLAKYNGHLRTS